MKLLFDEGEIILYPVDEKLVPRRYAMPSLQVGPARPRRCCFFLLCALGCRSEYKVTDPEFECAIWVTGDYVADTTRSSETPQHQLALPEGPDSRGEYTGARLAMLAQSQRSTDLFHLVQIRSGLNSTGELESVLASPLYY